MLKRRISNINTKSSIKYLGNNKLTLYNTTGFGANLLEDECTFDTTTGEGEIVFDNYITSIPNNAFKGKPDLLSITYMPNTVKYIGDGAFRMDGYTSHCESIYLNEGIVHVGNRAFLSVRALKTLKLPNTVETVDSYICNGCVNLEDITIGENFKKFNDTAGNTNNNVGSGSFGLAYKLKIVRWNAIHCEDFASSSKSPFSSDSMFGDKTEINPIKTVVFGNKVEHIPAYLFWKAQSLTGDIIIPESVKSIGDRCFQACNKINSIICLAKTPPKITPGNPNTQFTAGDGQNVVFRQYINNKWEVLPLKIYVPAESVELYKTDENWKIYASVIHALEYSYVDLGLKTSSGKKLLFANKNIGATNPEDPGYYFAWAEKEGHEGKYMTDDYQEGVFIDGRSFDTSSYKHANEGYTTMLKYNDIDNLTSIQPEDDAAKYYIGESWRIPTRNEIELLLDTNKFTLELIDLNDKPLTSYVRGTNIKGVKITSKISGYVGNSIFLPACGAGVDNKFKDNLLTMSIWTSTRGTSDRQAYFFYVYINSNNSLTKHTTLTNRYYGRQLRAVMEV